MFGPKSHRVDAEARGADFHETTTASLHWLASRRTKSLHRRSTSACPPFLRYGGHAFSRELSEAGEGTSPRLAPLTGRRDGAGGGRHGKFRTHRPSLRHRRMRKRPFGRARRADVEGSRGIARPDWRFRLVGRRCGQRIDAGCARARLLGALRRTARRRHNRLILQGGRAAGSRQGAGRRGRFALPAHFARVIIRPAYIARPPSSAEQSDFTAEFPVMVTVSPTSRRQLPWALISEFPV